MRYDENLACGIGNRPLTCYMKKYKPGGAYKLQCQECGYVLISESNISGFITEIVMKCQNCG